MRALPAPAGVRPLRAPSARARRRAAGVLVALAAGLGDDIVNTIACHAREGEGAPKVVETVLIHQADFATFDPLVMKGKGLLIE